jgi:hypothetical protein
MSVHGGKRKGAGRKLGGSNKKRAEIIETAQKGGEMPLDYMLRVMRDKTAEHSRRDEMAKSAAPFLHSKMPTAIVTPPPPSGPVADDDKALLDQYINGLHEEAEDA